MDQAEPEPTDQFVDVPGGRIFVREWLPSVILNNVPLLLLHDSLGCVGLWHDFPTTLAKHLSRPVIAYDRLGFGRSSARDTPLSTDFIREEAEEYFPAIRSVLGLKDFILLGHSVGGAMALLIASRIGGACVAVICESAQAFVEERTVAGILKAQEHFKVQGQFDKLTKWHGAKAGWVLRAWIETWLSPQFAAWSLEPDLPRVRCPVLAIHGDQDDYGSIRFPELICRRAGGPTEMHVLNGVGHVPHRERPDVVTQLVAGFLEAWLARRTG